MISLLLAIFFIILFIILSILGGNYLLSNMLHNAVGKKEDFGNFNDSSNINKIDECKKIDLENYNQLNFQTTTNIPLSPTNYKNYIGSVYIDNTKKDVNQLDKGKYCMSKPKLLYDGIWDSKINDESPYEHETWNLTNGNISKGYYCSDKIIEVNKPIPDNYKDKTAVYNNKNGQYYYTYCNDNVDDINDTEIQCFGEIFNAGIYQELNQKYNSKHNSKQDGISCY